MNDFSDALSMSQSQFWFQLCVNEILHTHLFFNETSFNVTIIVNVIMSHVILGFIFRFNSRYDSFSDVPESSVWFASKNLTPCRMH